MHARSRHNERLEAGPFFLTHEANCHACNTGTLLDLICNAARKYIRPSDLNGIIEPSANLQGSVGPEIDPVLKRVKRSGLMRQER